MLYLVLGAIARSPSQRKKGPPRRKNQNPAEESEPSGKMRTQLGKRLGQQARDVHLGDADLLGDLRLGEVAVEAQGKDLLFAVVEGGQGGAEGDAGFGEF